MVIITIGGNPGSGKSTVGKMLAARLEIPFFSMGSIRRKYALENGMTFAEFNKKLGSDPKYDLVVDEYQTKLLKLYDSFIVDSRLGYHFLPKSVKIYLRVDPSIAAQRVHGESRVIESANEIGDLQKLLQERESFDMKRYREYYNIDPSNPQNYDLVIDSTNTDPITMMHKILLFLRLKGVKIPDEKR